MGSLVWLKRLLPFFVTFAIGLFIASFFVNVRLSGFRGFRAHGWERHQQMQRLRIENEELRNENLRLRNESDHSHCKRSIDLETGEEVDSLMPLDAPESPVFPGHRLSPQTRK
ncbi:MAG: hypothetical protein ACKVQJ_03860 [Pyrinomonadaceae bacterium]